jgi:hypothetical protein
VSGLVDGAIGGVDAIDADGFGAGVAALAAGERGTSCAISFRAELDAPPDKAK